MPRLTRREFLARSAACAAAAPFLALLEACGDSVPPVLQQNARRATEPFVFSAEQRRALAAAMARLVPAQHSGDWSAVDAGAVEYLEQLLNAFATGSTPRLYGGGPTRDRFGTFWKLPRIKQVGWMAEVTRLREVYAAGLDRLNAWARARGAAEFAVLPAPAQDAALNDEDQQRTPFFAALFAHTMEGVYSHPVYGGNRDEIGWRSVGYAGDVHGVRFPGGHDAAAEDEPWRKYGGYSPDEMIRPGSGGGS